MISSLHNPTIRHVRALRRRRERERSGQLVVEGLRLVEDALAAGLVPEILFHTTAAAENPRIATLLDSYPERTLTVSDAVMADIADTVTPQGIAALLPMPRLAWPAQPTLLLVADQLRDPGNLGTLLRSAAAAGVQGVIAPRGTVDPWSDKVLRAGMGAHFRLPVRDGLAWDEVAPLLAGTTVRLADAAGEKPYDRADWRAPSTLVVGGEAFGAGDAAIPHIQERVTIPMVRAVESLNAAMAGSVILFEAARQRRQDGG